MAVKGLGIAPSEFWKMRPRDFWWLVEAERPPKKKSQLTRADAKGLRKMLDMANASKP
jgi:hypothetical protein